MTLCLVSINPSIKTFSPQIAHNYYDPREFLCLAKNIYHESRGEPLEGQLLVAYVTLNRKNHANKWSSTICQVVYEPSQFSWTLKRSSITNAKDWETSKLVARLALNTYVPTKTLYFHTKAVNPRWNKKLQHFKTVGNHIFYNDNQS